MKQIINEKNEVLFEGTNSEMTLAYKYLTEPLYVLAETMGLRMNDGYELNKKYWNDEARKSESFHLINV